MLKEYERICVKVKVKQNWPHVQTLQAKKDCETGSSVFVQMLKQAAVSNGPMPVCVQRIICSVWEKKNSFDQRAGHVFLYAYFIFYFILWNGSKWCACFLSSSKYLMMCQNEASLLGTDSNTGNNGKKRKDRLHVWTRCVHPILLMNISVDESLVFWQCNTSDNMSHSLFLSHSAWPQFLFHLAKPIQSHLEVVIIVVKNTT